MRSTRFFLVAGFLPALTGAAHGTVIYHALGPPVSMLSIALGARASPTPGSAAWSHSLAQTAS